MPRRDRAAPVTARFLAVWLKEQPPCPGTGVSARALALWLGAKGQARLPARVAVNQAARMDQAIVYAAVPPRAGDPQAGDPRMPTRRPNG
jgi:hypothetical protein